MRPRARIVLVTVRDEPSVIPNPLSFGALGYVLKRDAGGGTCGGWGKVVAGGG
jgi:hypothetical protein